MRVLHIFDHSAPLQSGYVTRSLGILRSQRALGLEVAGLTTPRHGVAIGQEGPAVEEVEGERFFRTAMPRPRFGEIGPMAEMRATTERLVDAIETFRPDILHAHSPSLNAFPAFRARRRCGMPAVYEIRAFWEDAAVDAGATSEGSLRYRLTRALETRAVRLADHIFTICEGLRDDLARRGVPDERLSVAPNAVEHERLPPIRTRDAELASALGLGEGPVLGFVGSFYPYEGLGLLIDSFPAIRAIHPEARLLLVGGGPEGARLRERAASLGDAVIFTGRVPPERVRAHYGLIDLLVYPRMAMRLTDIVTPLKPLEAMSMGRRFIASDVGGHRELVRDGETGRLFAAGDGDALVAAALAALDPANEAQNDALLRAGLAFILRERSWEAVAARYPPVYERLLRRRAAA